MSVKPKVIRDIRIVERIPTWRGQNYTISYLLLDQDPSVGELLAANEWAQQEKLQNPRVIPPSTVKWSSLFNPRFFRAMVMDGRIANRDRSSLALAWSGHECTLNRINLTKFWLESLMFLAGVTLSAAIVQSRYSAGTIGSKYDRLWEAGVLANCGVVPELQILGLMPAVRSLADDRNIGDVERILAIRALFMAVLSSLAPSGGTLTMIRAESSIITTAERFGFVKSLVQECGPSLRALIAYGSSISSSSFADYDVLVIVENPEWLLRRLAGRSPKWNGKELNIGIYSPEELIVMQRLSGDNLANYGVCLWGEISVVDKPFAELIARNFSFGVVRQRQQLGMLSRATEPLVSQSDDRRNLYDYFVKIPANVAKGTFGAMGERLPKEAVVQWLKDEVNFDPTLEQQRAIRDPVSSLAASALATILVMEKLNERTKCVHQMQGRPLRAEVI